MTENAAEDITQTLALYETGLSELGSKIAWQSQEATDAIDNVGRFLYSSAQYIDKLSQRPGDTISIDVTEVVRRPNPNIYAVSRGRAPFLVEKEVTRKRTLTLTELAVSILSNYQRMHRRLNDEIKLAESEIRDASKKIFELFEIRKSAQEELDVKRAVYDTLCQKVDEMESEIQDAGMDEESKEYIDRMQDLRNLKVERSKAKSRYASAQAAHTQAQHVCQGYELIVDKVLTPLHERASESEAAMHESLGLLETATTAQVAAIRLSQSLHDSAKTHLITSANIGHLTVVAAHAVANVDDKYSRVFDVPLISDEARNEAQRIIAQSQESKE